MWSEDCKAEEEDLPPSVLAEYWEADGKEYPPSVLVEDWKRNEKDHPPSVVAEVDWKVVTPSQWR